MTWFLFVVLMNMFGRKLPSCFGSWVPGCGPRHGCTSPHISTELSALHVILPAMKNSQTDEKEPPARSLSLRVLFFRADFLAPLGLGSASIETALNMLSILLARSSILV